jgi:D-sedoheptulose 7-phosphate isomerase/D-glycero-D-manno-heptose 1,7-bisphosphate phosphatase
MTTPREIVLLAPVDDTAAAFPNEPHASMTEFFPAYSERLASAARTVDSTALDRAAELLLQAYVAGNTVFTCGNGGSAAIANHTQCDHVKGVRAKTGLAPKVVSLSNNVELMTAIANDIAFEHLFAYQLESHARSGDVLLAISSSGRSPNIIAALEFARRGGLRTVALTGFDGGEARRIADVAIHVDCRNYGIVEDVHQSVMHALAQFVQQSLMTADAVRSSVF